VSPRRYLNALPLYLIFQDIAPQSHLARHWAPPLGTVLGFFLALYSKMLLGHPD